MTEVAGSDPSSDPSPLTFAAFNIQKLGVTKVQNQFVLDNLVKVSGTFYHFIQGEGGWLH